MCNENLYMTNMYAVYVHHIQSFITYFGNPNHWLLSIVVQVHKQFAGSDSHCLLDYWFGGLVIERPKRSAVRLRKALGGQKSE